MNFIDSISAAIEQLTALINRLEDFMDQILNLTIGELQNAVDSIQSQVSDFHQQGLAIMSSLEPASLRYAAGYWTRGGLRRRWISYRGRSKRGGRWYRGWGQRRYTWRQHHYQQEHNYSRLTRNDAITVNVRRGNVLMLMPATQEAIMDILPLVQPVTWSATSEPSEPQLSEASALEPVLPEPFTPQPAFVLPSRTQLQFTHSSRPQQRVALPSLRLFTQRSRAQPLYARFSRGRPIFAQPNRPPRGLTRAVYRAQPVRLYVDQPSAMEEPNRLLYGPFPIQSSQFRAISTNSSPPSAVMEHDYSVIGAPVEQATSSAAVPVPEQVVLNPIVPELEQVVPVPIITDPPNETI